MIDDTPIFEVHRMLTLSTAHVPKDVANQLDREADEFVIVYQKSSYGWFIPIGPNLAYPLVLKPIIDFATKHDCTWLMFDNAADVIEGLPTYEW